MRILEIRESPITLELAKQHLRVGSSTHDDTIIAAKLDMAIAVAEDMTGRILREKKVTFDTLIPTDAPLVRLPVPTTQIERLCVSQFLIPEKDYTLLEDDYTPMLVTEPQYAGERVSIVAIVGYNKDNIPPAIKAAILLILGTLYDNESDNLVGRSVSELSLTAEKLLLPWRVTPYGSMKREQALRIARTLVAQTSDIEIVDIKIKSMEPAGGRITVAVDAVNEEDENDRYEVEIDPTANSVSLKKVKGSYSLDEYLNEPTLMSELNPGQLFKLKYDCVVYEYYRTVRDRENRAIYRFTRKGSCNIAQSVHDAEVFPIG